MQACNFVSAYTCKGIKGILNGLATCRIHIPGYSDVSQNQ